MLTTKISFFRSSVNICIEDTFQIRMFAEDEIKEFVIKLVVDVGEDYNNQKLIRFISGEYSMEFTTGFDFVTFVKTIIDIVSRIRD